MTDAIWSVYLVRCRDGSLYGGISTDVERRLQEHAAGGAKAAKYLRGRGPLTLVYARKVGDRSAASQAEYRLKQLSRSEKEALIAAAQVEPSRS